MQHASGTGPVPYKLQLHHPDQRASPVRAAEDAAAMAASVAHAAALCGIPILHAEWMVAPKGTTVSGTVSLPSDLAAMELAETIQGMACQHASVRVVPADEAGGLHPHV